jgi:hypothetical protein
MSDQLSRYYLNGNTDNPIPVSAGGSLTAPAGKVILMIIPDASWTGKAIGVTGSASITDDGTATGDDYANGVQVIAGRYTSVAVTAGRVLVHMGFAQ